MVTSYDELTESHGACAVTRVVHGRKLEVPGGDEVGGVRALGHGGDAGGVRESTAVGKEHRPVILAPDL